jgi:hypothetical protein
VAGHFCFNEVCWHFPNARTHTLTSIRPTAPVSQTKTMNQPMYFKIVPDSKG